MKVVWIVLAILAVLALALVGGIAMLGKSIAKANDEADRYATESLRAIGAAWDPEALISRMSEEAKASSPSAKVRASCEAFAAKYGDLKDPGEFTAFSTHVQSTTDGSSAIVETASHGTFEKASGRVVFTLVKTGDRWLIQSFNVE